VDTRLSILTLTRGRATGFMIRIAQGEALEAFKVTLAFENGVVGTVDFSDSTLTASNLKTAKQGEK